MCEEEGTWCQTSMIFPSLLLFAWHDWFRTPGSPLKRRQMLPFNAVQCFRYLPLQRRDHLCQLFVSSRIHGCTYRGLDVPYELDGPVCPVKNGGVFWALLLLLLGSTQVLTCNLLGPGRRWTNAL